MGSGDWIKNIIRLKKPKSSGRNRTSSSKTLKEEKKEESSSSTNLVKDQHVAAIKIQTAFRAHLARRTLGRLRGMIRLQILTQSLSVKKQASNTLKHLQKWNTIHSQIRIRRHNMVTEGRIKQKKLENRLKLEAKLHHLEVDWCGGSDSMEEILARIHQREEAAVKRERAMAYAFSHQWRANSRLPNYLGDNDDEELGKANWGWSWVDRWIVARPWENRSSPKKPVKKVMLPVKSISPNSRKAF
ncbi:protein IQ-DOMAIN 9-like [Impatiens glandulifera]|uniref:protein IQ-DOMAIN 9-like n=1 Tax=Impatiens glandulifera TaxID=253017 RepID=UPI001FB0F386|nr:protein IQ-DOMAIN 9-like [Impatiens glandulifera]XP_047327606.1 protein IQ-DOMAIN 9-like [Impatiens glandulifera]